MTLSEFKAWFEGFTETLDGPPDAKQWKRIKARVQEITGSPITRTVYVDRYRDYFRDFAYPGAVWSASGVGNVVTARGGGDHDHRAIYATGTSPNQLLTDEFDSHRALRAAGAAELKSLSS